MEINSMIYVTRGDAKIQIVNHQGQRLLDDQVTRRQVVVVPMGYAAVIRAGNEGFEWATFHTFITMLCSILWSAISRFFRSFLLLCLALPTMFRGSKLWGGLIMVGMKLSFSALLLLMMMSRKFSSE